MSANLRTPIPERIQKLIKGEVEATAEDIFQVIELRHELMKEREKTTWMLATAAIDYLLGELDRVADKFQEEHKAMFT